MKKCTTTRLAACAAIVIGAALTLRAAEVTEAVAKETVAGWASLQEALTAKDRFAGAAVATFPDSVGGVFEWKGQKIPLKPGTQSIAYR